jgi:hypothetical protein
MRDSRLLKHSSIPLKAHRESREKKILLPTAEERQDRRKTARTRASKRRQRGSELSVRDWVTTDLTASRENCDRRSCSCDSPDQGGT